ncbi:hypothetical protein Back11_28750 [Paenibacillus baekrokdamisoli]|uniref:Uncharacterized protein n=1 Tax=Paenibacillus baekrokdamisoli TaxID=1712516 RepID=A0A3G9IRP3_9BACL|nr:hypothetical protein [Paenibacillus baekrokdamisoli]MBB3071112.1 hypothetical protein [Paenibacillus baekrokdamisoli]BBH21530.1 hypothetical protein Back11_28750 [Paenibacillus baekrokdamisoli]
MKLTDKANNEQNAYLFNVDLLVQDESNARAMERLIQLLNQCGFDDYRIKSGIELGQLIEALEAKKAIAGSNLNPSGLSPKVEIPTSNHSSVNIQASKSNLTETQACLTLVTERIQASIAENRLIRLMINKGFGVKLNIPCRIINFDITTQMLTVYHVDEKQVYSFTLNEIDDFVI